MRAKPLSLKFRLLGILPLTFFLAQALHYWRIDQLGHMLWMCNMGNLMLAAGLFLDQPLLIRMALIWMIPGLLIWGRYVVTEWFHYTTLDWTAVASGTSAHIGGLIVGLFAVRRVRFDRAVWLYAFAWYLILQLISRITTPAELNVNVSHKIYDAWQGAFTSYWRFWLVMTVLVAASLWLLGLLLNKLWPGLSQIDSQS